MKPMMFVLRALFLICLLGWIVGIVVPFGFSEVAGRIALGLVIVLLAMRWGRMAFRKNGPAFTG